MALDDIPPWLRPPNFLAAMEAGAHAGLGARNAALAETEANNRLTLGLREAKFKETEAGDRLRLAYDQLAKQERLATMQAMAKQKLGEAGLALRAAQANALMQYHKDVTNNTSNRNAILGSHYADLGDFYEDRAANSADANDIRAKHFDEMAQNNSARLNRPVVKQLPDGRTAIIYPNSGDRDVLGEAVTKPGEVTLNSDGSVFQTKGAPNSQAVMEARRKASADLTAPAQPGFFSRMASGIGSLLGNASVGDPNSPAPPQAPPTPPVPASQDFDYPDAPLNPAERKANTIYNTPKGLHTWTGTGWNVAEDEGTP